MSQCKAEIVVQIKGEEITLYCGLDAKHEGNHQHLLEWPQPRERE